MSTLENAYLYGMKLAFFGLGKSEEDKKPFDHESYLKSIFSKEKQQKTQALFEKAKKLNSNIKLMAHSPNLNYITVIHKHPEHGLMATHYGDDILDDYDSNPNYPKEFASHY